MIQIDIPMPKSCKVCPFCEDTDCSIMPGVPAWINVSKYTDTRSEHCPLKEIKYTDATFRYDLECCPFCGGKARILADNKGYFVMCDSCEARTAQFLHNNNTDDVAERCAVMNWNQRC
jgi:hypothetical protein